MDRIRGRDLNRSIWLNYIAGSLGIPWFITVMGFPITMFMERLGATTTTIGLLLAVQSFTNILQVPATLFTERIKRRKPLWVALASLHRPIAVLPVVYLWWLGADDPAIQTLTVITIGISFAIAKIVEPLWFSWMADLVPDKIRGRFWGRRNAITTFVALLTTSFAGKWLDYADQQLGDFYFGFSVLIIAASCSAVTDVLLHAFVKEPTFHSTHSDTPVFERIFAPFKNRNYRYLIIAFSAWGASQSIIGSMEMVYLKRVFQATYTQISILTVVASIAGILSGLACGKIIDKIGSRAFAIIMMSILPIFRFIWFFTAPQSELELIPSMLKPFLLEYSTELAFYSVMPLIAPMFFLFSIFGAGVLLCQYAYTAELAPRKGRSMYLATSFAFIGLFIGIGQYSSGLIADLFNENDPLWTIWADVPFTYIHLLVLIHAVIMWGVAVPMLNRIKKTDTDTPVRTLLVKVSPFRLFEYLKKLVLWQNP